MGESKNLRATLLKWISIVLLIISILIIYLGMNIIQGMVDKGEASTVADHSKSDVMILFGSMLFGVSGGMLTNIFTVYDNKHADERFDKIEDKLDKLSTDK